MRNSSKSCFDEMVSFPLWKLEAYLGKLYDFTEYLTCLKYVDMNKINQEMSGAIAIGERYLDDLAADLSQQIDKAIKDKEAKND